MSHLSFSGYFLSITDLPSRAIVLADDQTADVLGGWGWVKKGYKKSKRALTGKKSKRLQKKFAVGTVKYGSKAYYAGKSEAMRRTRYAALRSFF